MISSGCRTSGESKVSTEFSNKDNWSSCCKGNACGFCSLSNTEQKGRSYLDKTISHSSFEQVYDSGGQFRNCSFENATIDTFYITQAKIEHCRFKNSKIKNLKIKQSVIDGLSFEDSTIENLSIEGSIKGLELKGLSGQGLDLKSNQSIVGLEVRDTVISGFKLNGANLDKARIMSSGLADADLQASSWKNSLIVGVDLGESKVKKMVLDSVDVCGTKFDWSQFVDSEVTFCESKQEFCFSENKYVFREGETWRSKIPDGHGEFVCEKGRSRMKKHSCDSIADKTDKGCSLKTCTTSQGQVLQHGQSREIKDNLGDVWVETCSSGVIQSAAPNKCPNSLYVKEGFKCQSPCNNKASLEKSGPVRIFKSQENMDIIVHCIELMAPAWSISCRPAENWTTHQIEQTYFGGCYRTPSDSPGWQLKPFTFKTSVFSSAIPAHIPPEVCSCRFRNVIENDGVSLNQ